MRIIYKIAKGELQMLFYSPVAWLILVVFMVQAAYTFGMMYEMYARYQEVGGSIAGLSLNIFGNWEGIFVGVQKYLYFYIPLLTMGLVSRELSSGSIRLLYSSPVTNIQIILGKFLSMMIYSGIMMGLLALLIVYASFTIHEFELAAVLSGLLGVYLLACAYAAIGIFMSSLTSYQVVAAIGTFAVLLGLSQVGGLWQQYDFIRDVTYWLSINGRCNTFIRGMICSEDILYFLIVIALFLSLTIIRLHAVRQRIKFWITCGKNVLVISLACILGYLSALPEFKYYNDTTKTKINTLTPISQDVVSRLEGGITITSYINILEPSVEYVMPEFLKPDMERFEQYQRFKPEMKLRYVYYYGNTNNAALDKRYPDLNDRQRMVKLSELYKVDSNKFVPVNELDPSIDLASEGYSFVRQIVRENGEKSWLRTYNDLQVFPAEAEITAAFKRMVMTLPRIGFLQTQGERSFTDSKDRSYSVFSSEKKFRHSLMNQGFDVEEVVLDKRVPENIKVLVIADMRESFKPEEEVYLQEYIDRGGNLFIATEPKRDGVMNPLLTKFGFSMVPGTLVKWDSVLLADVVLSYPTKEAGELAYPFTPLYLRKYVVTTPGCAGLEQIADCGYTVTTLFKTDTLGVWNELETVDFIDDTVRMDPEIGEREKCYPTIVALSRKVGEHEQKIIISGDADCISNNEFRGRSKVRSANYSLITGSFFWLSDNEMPIDVRRPRLPDNKLFLSQAGARVTKGIFLIFIPLVLGVAGVVIWVRRKGR